MFPRTELFSDNQERLDYTHTTTKASANPVRRQTPPSAISHHQIGTLYVYVHKGKNLVVRDHVTSDPYCVISYGDSRERTKTINNTLNPKWKEALSFPVFDTELSLDIQLYDEDDNKNDDFMGAVSLPAIIKTLTPHVEKEEVVALKGVAKGKFHFRVTWAPSQHVEQHPADSQHRKNVEEAITSVEGNRQCADCNAPDPCWASTNLGVLICIKCSGVHRKLGAHVTKILSIKLDDWVEEDVEFMKTVGNTKFNAEWEAALPSLSLKPTDLSSPGTREAFIRAKYELRSLSPGGDGVIPPIALTVANSQVGMVEYVGVLFVELLKGEGLKRCDLFTSDPYVKLTVPPKTHTSEVKANTLNPEWTSNNRFTFNVLDQRSPLQVEVWDSDYGKQPDDEMGRATFFFDDLPPSVPVQRWLALTLKDKTYGKLLLQLTWSPLDH